MNDTPTPTPRADEWEAYCDECYYHFWRLRRKTERGWYDGFHIHTGEEAKGLCNLLNKLETELAAVTEQRDAVTLRLGDTQVRMFNAERQRDRLAEACKSLMDIVGAPNSTADDCWASEAEIDTAWNMGNEALKYQGGCE